ALPADAARHSRRHRDRPLARGDRAGCRHRDSDARPAARGRRCRPDHRVPPGAARRLRRGLDGHAHRCGSPEPRPHRGARRADRVDRGRRHVRRRVSHRHHRGAPGISRFLLGRAIQAAVTLLLLSLVVFALARATGDPLTLVLPLGATEEDFENARRYLGLDRPIYVQYAKFAGNAILGDFGVSLRARKPVNDLLAERLPSSLKLAAFSMTVTLLFAFPLGVLAAVRKDTVFDTG